MLWLIDDRIDASTRDAGTRKNPNAKPDEYAANNVVPAGNAAKTTAPRSAPIKAASCFTSKEASPVRTTCQATKPMTAPKHPDPNISKVIVLPRSPCLTANASAAGAARSRAAARPPIHIWARPRLVKPERQVRVRLQAFVRHHRAVIPIMPRQR